MAAAGRAPRGGAPSPLLPSWPAVCTGKGAAPTATAGHPPGGGATATLSSPPGRRYPRRRRRETRTAGRPSTHAVAHELAVPAVTAAVPTIMAAVKPSPLSSKLLSRCWFACVTVLVRSAVAVVPTRIVVASVVPSERPEQVLVSLRVAARNLDLGSLYCCFCLLSEFVHSTSSYLAVNHVQVHLGLVSNLADRYVHQDELRPYPRHGSPSCPCCLLHWALWR